MYDRILRSELFESNRYLDLHTDTSRLTWISLIPLADDFGNLDGNTKRLWRWLTFRTTLKTEPDVVKVLSELCDADLLRRYEVDGQPWFHIPRFECDRDYVTRRYPKSPWDDEENSDLEARMVKVRTRRKALRSERAIVDSQSKLPKVHRTIDEQSQYVHPEFRLGVGEKIKNIVTEGESEGEMFSPERSSSIVPNSTRGSRLPSHWSLPPDWLAWAMAFAKDQGKPVTESQVSAIAHEFRDYWVAVPGAKGRKSDWLATWRNRFRDRLPRLPAHHPPDDPTSPTGIMRRAT